MARLLVAALARGALAASSIESIGRRDGVALLQARTDVAEPSPTDSREPYRQTLINFGDAQYVTYMTLGRQLISGMVDTGSSELVVFGSGCSTCGPAAHYNPRLSATFAEGSLQMQQLFGSGRTFCKSGQEDVTIGPFHSENQTFWAAQTADMPILENAAFEAVIGLGPPQAPMVHAWKVAVDAVQLLTDTYDMGELAPRKLVEEAQSAIDVAKSVTAGAPMLKAFNCSVFSVCLGAKPGSNGILVWNDNIVEEHPKLFTKVPVSANASWSVELSEPSLHGRRGSFRLPCGAGGCTASLDTGSSLLSVPREVKDLIQEAMEDLDEDCSNLEVLPSLHFKLGEATVSLTPDTFVAKVNGSTGKTARAVLERVPALSSGRHGCKLLLMESDGLAEDNKPLWVLGVPFFRKYYTTFNLGASTDERAVYIAAHADNCELQETHTSFLLRGLEPHTVEAARIRLPRSAAAAAASVPEFRA